MPPMLRMAHGFWGPPTSTLDWCEENYVVTSFIAEFWNTISNWIMIVPPLLGAVLTWQTRHETRYMLAFFSLFRSESLAHGKCVLPQCLISLIFITLIIVVGTGSLAFHATLLYQMQLLDELPMIYCTCVFLFCVIECASEPGSTNVRLAVALACCGMLITFVYLTLVNPLVFLWAYGILASSLIVIAVVKLRLHKGSRKLLLISTVSYGFGFILWNFENTFCSSVRAWRNTSFIPLPLTQLHAIWHLLAGVGSYYHILYSFDLRMKCRGKNTTVKLVWDWLPYIHVPNAKLKADLPNQKKSSNYSSTSSLFQLLFSHTNTRGQ